MVKTYLKLFFSFTGDLRVELFPYLCALLAVVVILLIAKLIVDFYKKRHPVNHHGDTKPAQAKPGMI